MSKHLAHHDCAAHSAIHHWMVQAAVAAALTLICLGCASSRRAGGLAEGTTEERAAAIAQLSGSESNSDLDGNLADATRRGPGESDKSRTRLAAALAELDAIGAIDKTARQRLLEDLQNTDPALWPQVIDYARATLAYQQKLRGEATPAQFAAAESPPTAGLPVAQLPVEPLTPAPARPAASVVPTALTSSETKAAGQGPVQSAVYETPGNSAAAAASTIGVVAELPNATATGPPTIAPPQSLPEQPAAPAGATSSAALQASPANFTAAGPPSVAAPLDTAIAALVGGESATGPSTQAATALALEAAASKLRDAGPLGLSHLAFCTEVTSFGVYNPFDANIFAPGQEVLLYAEVDGFKAEPVNNGFRTALSSNYEIVDRQGHPVDVREFGLTEEVCRNRRRDFFIRYQFHLPTTLDDGAYTLRLNVTDALGHKTSAATINFTIKQK
ncbi:MAG: hypothetical protein AB7O68_14345 [Pirellulales bacterium]